MESVILSGLQPSVGLEIHVRLRTRCKLFCKCPNATGGAPNAIICPVCMGLPGTLPVFNEEVLDPAVRLGLALGCEIQLFSRFDRKHYFYPDLPRNFQITQLVQPLGLAGRFGGVESGFREGECPAVHIRRIHLEEDAGRLVAGQERETVGVDLDRAGAPLVEIVTEPDLRDGASTRAWLLRVRQLLIHLGVSDGELENGSLRCDANVGFLDLEGRSGTPGTGAWTELKNLNSPGVIQRAVDHEIARLSALIQSGEKPANQTRAWEPLGGKTILLRSKEDSPDYRYIREPDLPAVVLNPEWIATRSERLPEPPRMREGRWAREWGLAQNDAAILGKEPAVAAYFEEVVEALAEYSSSGESAEESARSAARWILAEILAFWQGTGLEADPCPVSPARLASLLRLLEGGSISGTAAKRILEALKEDPAADPAVLMHHLNLELVTDPDSIRRLCRKVIAAHPEAAISLAAGKIGLLDFLVGKVMKESEGRASPSLVKNTLRSMILK